MPARPNTVPLVSLGLLGALASCEIVAPYAVQGPVPDGSPDVVADTR